MAVYGDLNDFELPDILAALSNHGKSGWLRLSTGSDEITLIFDRGTIISVQSSDINLRLGQLLIRQGYLDRDRMERALMLQALTTPPTRIGDVLVDMGYVTRRQIADAVAMQLRASLFRLLVQPGGTFAFTPKAAVASTARPPDLYIEPVVLEAIRLADEWLATHPYPETVTLVDEELAPGSLANLSEPEQHVLLAVLNGVSALEGLATAAQLPTPEFDAVLAALCRRGLVLRLNGQAGEHPADT